MKNQSMKNQPLDKQNERGKQAKNTTKNNTYTPKCRRLQSIVINY